VCEGIPYLILPVRQSSREPHGRRRHDIRKPSGSRWACAERSTKARIRPSAASGTTFDREGDGRIREELESLGRR